MAQGGVDRRVAGIIKWLERFENSYRSGAMENALMDAECARADMEDLRLDVWSRVGVAHAPRRCSWFGVPVCAATAVLMVLATAAPLSVVRYPAWDNGEVSVAPREAAIMTKASEAERTPEPAVAVAPRVEAEKNARTAPKRARRPAATQKTAAKPAVPEAREVRKRTVPDDKMFSLVQMGSRALKGGSAIEVKGMGKGEGKL